jgi:hypothetical protein
MGWINADAPILAVLPEATPRAGLGPVRNPIPGPHTMLALSTECLEGEGH